MTEMTVRRCAMFSAGNIYTVYFILDVISIKSTSVFGGGGGV